MELDFEQLKKVIPQRFPFIMIDRAVDVKPGKEATTLKNVSGNDIFFLGHFPQKAVMPGVAILEAMAQTAIVLFAAENSTHSESPLYYLGSVKARFHHPVVPGDCLTIKAVSVKSLPAGAYVTAEASVGDRKVAEAELVFSIKNE